MIEWYIFQNNFESKVNLFDSAFEGFVSCKMSARGDVGNQEILATSSSFENNNESSFSVLCHVPGRHTMLRQTHPIPVRLLQIQTLWTQLPTRGEGVCKVNSSPLLSPSIFLSGRVGNMDTNPMWDLFSQFSM